MTAFIRQEALEKAREIQLKADEEFAIEKSKLVRQETAAIDTLYEKKHKQAAMSQQITRSTLSNRTRLRVLGGRQELLDTLFQQARDKVNSVAGNDKKKYQATLKGLVLEGLYLLNEEKVSIRGRKKDADAVKKASSEAVKEFKTQVGYEPTVTLDESEPLSEGSYVLLFHYPLTGSLKLIRLSIVPAVSLSLEERARLRSTTPSRSACGYSRSMLFPQYEKRCSERTRTGDSTTKHFFSQRLTGVSCSIVSRALL